MPANSTLRFRRGRFEVRVFIMCVRVIFVRCTVYELFLDFEEETMKGKPLNSQGSSRILLDPLRLQLESEYGFV